MRGARFLFAAGLGVAIYGCVDLSGVTGGDPPTDCPKGTVLRGNVCEDAILRTDCNGTPPCSGHGSCDDGKTCRCQEGYVGELCDTCAEGFQDNDINGKCEPSCAKAALTCGLHSACTDADGTPVCACAPGYALDGGACVWRGGPKDPGFEQAAVWTAEGGVVIDPAAAKGPGAVDVGFAKFVGEAACKAGLVKQTFDMPNVKDAEPMQLVLSARSTNPRFPIPARVLVGINGTVSTLSTPFGTSFATTSVCLGERAFGGPVTLTLGASPDSFCFDAPEMYIDRAHIEPSANCPVPGTVFNGDFDGLGGWTVSPGAEVAPGVGTGGTRGAKLQTDTFCKSTSMTGTAAPPFSTMKSPALSVVVQGTVSQTAQISAYGTLGEIRGTGTFVESKVCIPAYMRGVASPIYLRLPYVSPPTNGACTDAAPRTFFFDDMKFVEDPTCGPDPGFVLDGGFEREAVSPWTLTANAAGISTSIVQDAAGAKAGARYLRLRTSQTCKYASGYQYVTVPPPEPGKGPAMKFFYKTLGAGTGFTATSVGTLPPAPDWVEKTACLPPARVGQPQYVSFTVNTPLPAGGTCGTAAASDTLMIDEVRVTTDPACPDK